MKIRVFIDAREVEEDGVIVSSRSTTLWFRVDPGYDEAPPEGVFSVDGVPVNGTAYPSWAVTPPRGGRRYTVRFESTASPNQASILLSRLLTFIPPGQIWVQLATAVIAAPVLFLFSWKTGIALHHGEGRVQSLWSGTAILPTLTSLLTILLTTLGVARRSWRTWFLTNFWLSEGAIVATTLLALVVPFILYGVVTNAAPEKVRPFPRFSTELEPGQTTLYVRAAGLGADLQHLTRPPFSACTLGDDCVATDASLTFLVLRAASADAKVLRCARPSVAKCFEEELAGTATCTPDPSMRIARAHSKLPRSDNDCEASRVAERYEREVVYDLKPFAQNVAKSFDTLRDVSVTLTWPVGTPGAYSEFVLEGRDLIEKVHFPLPATEKLTAAGPWNSREAGLLNGVVMSGTESVGKVACAVANGTKELKIEFATSGPHVRRVVVEQLQAADSVSNGIFTQRFDVDRPELVTHLPWCGEGDGRYAIDLYVDEAWAPEGWRITLPRAVASVRVHGPEGGYEGTWRVRKGQEARSGSLASHAVPGRIRRWNTRWQEWESYRMLAGTDTVVWAFEEGASFQVELWDGGRRLADRASNFVLRNLPLRSCLISRKDNSELPNDSRCEPDGSARDWLELYPHSGCSTSSRLCTPP